MCVHSKSEVKIIKIPQKVFDEEMVEKSDKIPPESATDSQIKK